VKTASENVVRAVARAMANARAGDVLAIAIVTVGERGEPEVTFAGEAELLPSVNLGLDMAKQTVIAMVADPQQQRTTSIVRAAN
jgi:hypothetical protein